MTQYGHYQQQSAQVSNAISDYYGAYAQQQAAYAQPVKKKNNTAVIVGLGVLAFAFRNEIKSFLKSAPDKKPEKKPETKPEKKPEKKPEPTPWASTKDYDPSYYGSVGDHDRTGYRTANQDVMHKGQTYFKKGDEYSLALLDMRRQITKNNGITSLQQAIDVQKKSGYDAVVTTNTANDPVTPGFRTMKAHQSGSFSGFDMKDNDRVGDDVVRHVIFVAPTPKGDVNLEGEVALNKDFMEDKFGVDGNHFHRVNSTDDKALQVEVNKVKAEIDANSTRNDKPVKHEVVIQVLPLHGTDRDAYNMWDGTPTTASYNLTEAELKQLVDDQLSGNNVETLAMVDACYSGNVTH